MRVPVLKNRNHDALVGVTQETRRFLEWGSGVSGEIAKRPLGVTSTTKRNPPQFRLLLRGDEAYWGRKAKA